MYKLSNQFLTYTFFIRWNSAGYYNSIFLHIPIYPLTMSKCNNNCDCRSVVYAWAFRCRHIPTKNNSRHRCRVRNNRWDRDLVVLLSVQLLLSCPTTTTTTSRVLIFTSPLRKQIDSFLLYMSSWLPPPLYLLCSAKYVRNKQASLG